MNVIDLSAWKRTRLGRGQPKSRRARPIRRREVSNGFRGIGEVSFQMLRMLSERKMARVGERDAGQVAAAACLGAGAAGRLAVTAGGVLERERGMDRNITGAATVKLPDGHQLRGSAWIYVPAGRKGFGTFTVMWGDPRRALENGSVTLTFDSGRTAKIIGREADIIRLHFELDGEGG
jgi:hypothetical protein